MNRYRILPSFFSFNRSNSRVKTWISSICNFIRVEVLITGFYLVLPCFTEFYRVFHWTVEIRTGRYRVLPSFFLNTVTPDWRHELSSICNFFRVEVLITGFYRVLPGFSLNRWNKNGPLPSFTEFFFKHSNSRLKTWIEFHLQFFSSWGLDYRVLPSFTGFFIEPLK